MRVSYLGIILLAIILRFWALGNVPAGFHADEVAYGYNAYSILKTGRDEYGKPFPLVLKSYGDYKAAVDSYLAIPFIVIGGLTEWSVRAPSAVFGILFILLIYAIVYRLSGNRRLAILSSALGAISPLGILLSRVQSDPLICMTFFYLALYSWFLWVDTRKNRYLFLIALSIFLSFFTYTVTRVFAIPFFLLVGWTFWPKLDRIARRVSLALFSLVFIAVLALYVTPAGAWFSQISVFSSQNVQLPLDEEIREDGAMRQPLLVTRVLHNKVVGYGRYLVKNYSDYFSFEFLFMQARQPLREQIPNVGVLMLMDLPFLLIGIYVGLKKRLSYAKFSIYWILLVPIGLSVASSETPNIHRFVLAMVPVHLLVALGILSWYQTVRPRWRRVMSVVVAGLFILNLGYVMHELFIHQPIHNPMYRNDEYTRLTREIKALYSSYDVIVTPQILGHILFYWPVDPAMYQKLGSPRDTQYGRLDKFFFVSDGCPSNLQNPKIRELGTSGVLYVDKAECKIDPKDKLVQTIRYQNSLEAYHLIEKK